MKFKVTKLAAAVAAGLGVSMVGMNIARADAILFPYFAVSDTVTSIFSVVNQSAASQLHYRYYYKAGSNAGVLGATCEHFDVFRVSSPNDIVTFDAGGHYTTANFPDAPNVSQNGVLFEPEQRNAIYPVSQSFTSMGALRPARGFLLVDNDIAGAAPADLSMHGEIFMVDFAGGAVWGYEAYNALASANVGGALIPLDFSDRAERAGAVIAGDPNAGILGTGTGGSSLNKYTSLMPIRSDVTTGEVTTKFFVTPIAHNAISGGVQIAPAQWQDAGNLSTQIRLNLPGGDPQLVMYDRDENPVSGSVPQTVVCVGAADVAVLVSQGALREVGDHGGWTGVVISSPAALTTVAGARTAANNQAIVIKLEYNEDGTLLGDTFRGTFNSAIWLRSDTHQESILPGNAFLASAEEDDGFSRLVGADSGAQLTAASGTLRDRLTIKSAFDGNTLLGDVSGDLPDTIRTISFQQ